ncbi:unnamed protein product [Cunninghamella echinulata]
MFKTIGSFLTSVINGTTMASTNLASNSIESIIHRVKVQNLPTKEMASVKKLFTNYGVTKYKKAPQWNYAYVNFDTEKGALDLINKINGVKFKKNILNTEYTQILESEYRNRFQQKNKISIEKKCEERKEEELLDTRTPSEKLADQVTPLYKIPYEDQLNKKHKVGVRQLRQLKKKLTQLQDMTEEGKKQLQWAFNQQASDLPCETILPPIGSPLINGYRNKCEFTIGKDMNGNPTVGFLLGLYRDGITNVLEPSQTLHIPDTAKTIAKKMEIFITQHSDYEVYDRVKKQGVWRSLMVKVQQTGDIMLLVQMKTMDLTRVQLQQEKEKLIDYWHTQKDINVTTLMLQQWNGDSNGITDRGQTEILTGDGYVYEHLLGYQFRISSSAFFQINTSATELMYSQCAEWCTMDNKKKTTLLDLCCGVGSIGISLAHTVDRVVGIEMISDAIDDARFNADLNNITNAQYYANKVEEKIDVVTNEVNENVIAVLDPPRNGVHNSVIRAVREASQIQKVIFISCDAKQAMQNFINLCRPTSNRFKGFPFKPNRAVTVDLFPHTDHSELMVEFVRIQPAQ